MDYSISEPQLCTLSEFVADQIGLHFPRERWNELSRGMSAAARELGFADVESAIRWLVASPLTRYQIEVLASHLTVGETYFFREKKTFEILEQHVLPELIRLRRDTEQRLRIWSAACCTGEEPYSIAIALSSMIPDVENWNVSILATDINPRFLQKASNGAYGDWSFRDTPSWIKQRYFKATKGNRFEILPNLKNMVAFSYLNLAEDVYPSLMNNTNAMDIILCRNVLMYFTPERVRRVVRNLHRCLVDGGWLIVSPSETSHVLYAPFKTVNFSGGIFYRKATPSERTVQSIELFPIPQVEETPTQLLPSLDLPEEHPENIHSIDRLQPLPSEVEELPKAERYADPYAEILVLYQQGSYVEATGRILELLAQKNSDARLMALLSRVYANQGKLDEAFEWSQKANAIDKLNPAYRYLLATILQERGQMEGAIVSLKQALYLDQEFVLAHFALANLMERQSKFIEARKYFQNALSLLQRYRPEEIVPESEGIAAGRLMEIISSTSLSGRAA